MDEENIAGFFLSGWYVFDNFAPFQIEWRSKLYPTSEHAYQAAHFFDTAPDIAEHIRRAKSPRLAADFANAHKDQEDPAWSVKKLPVMTELIHCKIEQHDLIRKALLDSGSKTIVEMNDNDSFWGWGPDRQGRNELGKIWMRLRGQLRREES